jgi:hypothetical protein
MNFAFKAFFNSASDTEAAYYHLRSKQLVTDIVTSDLSENKSIIPEDRIAYSLECNTFLSSSGSNDSISPATVFATPNPRVAMTPLLFNKKQAPPIDACYIYGHCRKKDISTIKNCLKKNGAFSILTSDLNQKNRIIY